MSTPLIWVAPGEVRLAGERGIDLLGQRYLKGVHGNQNKNDVVALGQTGTGQTPNYQVTSATGEKTAYRGQNHEAYGQTEEFDERNLSRSFSYEEILNAFLIAAGRRPRR